MNTTAEYQRPPVRVALMGLGRAMFFTHYPIFRAHPELFEVVCACDAEKERRDIVARDYPKCRMFRQFTDMLDEPDIDLVDIATCTRDHVKHALASLKKGFWTLLETPMALTVDDALILKGTAVKAKNRLVVYQRGMFSPDYLLARQMMSDDRLGTIFQIKVRREDYIRRDDWQTIKRLGGGVAYSEMTDLIIQTLKLLPVQPIQMWSELKRIASLGDAEDYAHVCFKTREQISADVEYSGGVLAQNRQPSFEIIGSLGKFSVNAGATEGYLNAVDPSHKFPRRRSSVRIPSLTDAHEDFPVITEAITLPRDVAYGELAFWKSLYEAVRIATPFPLALEDSIEAVKFVQLMKKTSPFGI